MNHVVRWSLLPISVLALILVPFFLLGGNIQAGTAALLSGSGARLSTVILLALLLTFDFVLPVPSSVISTALGALAGFAGGAMISFLAMTAGCFLGFSLGRVARPLAMRLLTNQEYRRFQTLRAGIGNWLLILARPVPVAAEASILFAGIADMPFRRFLLLCSLSNLGISLAYAAVGAFSVSVPSFLLALLLAVALPGLAMLIWRRRITPLVPPAA